MNSWMPYIVLIGIPMIIGLLAQAKISMAFGKWSKVPAASGLTGADVAQRILTAAGIGNVEVVQVPGSLTDHYDPRSRQVCLSQSVFGSNSVAALGVAAHECGHAIQHARNYAPMKLRSTVVPVTSIASKVLPFLILGGVFIPFLGMKAIAVAVVCYLVLMFFQLITLPVEFNASNRAEVILSKMGIVSVEEARGVHAVLGAAALTYVAAFVAALGQLLYWILILTGNRR